MNAVNLNRLKLKRPKGSQLRWGLLFIVAYLILLLLLVPVRRVYQQWQDQLPTITQLSGSFWQGSARDIQLPLALRSVSWQWAPLELLGGAVGYQLLLDQPDNRANLAVSWDRTLTIGDLDLNGRLSDWVSAVHGQPLPLDVSVSINLANVRLSQQGCAGLEQGHVKLHDWQGLMSGPLNMLGGIEADLSCTDGSLLVAFKGLAADLALTGRWSLSPSLQYSLDVRAKPQSAELSDRMRSLGFVKKATGELQLVRQGHMNAAAR